MKPYAYLLFTLPAFLAMAACSGYDEAENLKTGGYRVVWQDTVVYGAAPFNDTLTWELDEQDRWDVLTVVKDSFDAKSVYACFKDTGCTWKGVEDTLLYWIRVRMRQDSLLIAGEANTEPGTRTLEIRIADATATRMIKAIVHQEGRGNLP